MRRPRIKAAGGGFYHVVSRIGGKRFLLDDVEKGVLLSMIRSAAAFSGVTLLTYAVMDNHFHLLVHVPRRRDVGDGELLAKMQALYGTARTSAVLEKWEKWEKRGREDRVADEKERLRARMFDLSQFCKTFKETYSQDYNRRHENTGTIWEGRFKSILLEGSFRTLMSVASYIHLNPVRAAIVESPGGAKWTGYGAAVAGDAQAREGLRFLAAWVVRAADATWKQAHRTCLDAMEGILKTDSQDDFSPDEVSPGAIKTLFRSRVAGFLHGSVLGAAAFIRRQADLLPTRLRRPSLSASGVVSALGLESFAGVRGAS